MIKVHSHQCVLQLYEVYTSITHTYLLLKFTTKVKKFLRCKLLPSVCSDGLLQFDIIHSNVVRAFF